MFLKIHDRRQNQKYRKYTNYVQPRKRANNTKYSKTKLPGFSLLLRHSARKWDRFILQCSRAHSNNSALLQTSERIFAVDVSDMLYFIWVNVVKPDVVQVIAVTLAAEYIQAPLCLHVNMTHPVTHVTPCHTQSHMSHLVSPCHTSSHPPRDNPNSSTTTQPAAEFPLSQFPSTITRRKSQFSELQHPLSIQVPYISYAKHPKQYYYSFPIHILAWDSLKESSVAHGIIQHNIHK